ncbi:hypothetical protein [Saccharothrix sp. NRRL B-16314]|uniref:hypothetical protein n=1 Tax=Saccharothrix sp. NRRL B-16314 TaxID=1463825 RepID=UPI000526B295|nr:hypothetical protein [Saccharothrix sp. NRRL B-16314]
MKVLKACAVVLAVGTVLVGCGGSEWSGQVRFKVTEVKPDETLVSGATWPGRVSLDLDQEQPADAAPITAAWAKLTDVPSGTAIGDVLVCTVNERDDSKFDDAEPVREIGPCQKP